METKTLQGNELTYKRLKLDQCEDQETFSNRIVCCELFSVESVVLHVLYCICLRERVTTNAF